MLGRLRSRITYANVTATLALVLAMGGGAYALTGIPDGSGVFHGCVNNANGGLRVVKNAGSCRAIKKHKGKVVFPGESAIVWNQQGRPGSNGINGGNGTNGTNGEPGTARAYGRVKGDGTLTRSKNATIASHVSGSGTYCITPAAGIDPAATVLVATPELSGDSTGFQNNASQAVVEWRASVEACPAGQMEVDTGYRSESGSSPVNSVNQTPAEESFSFVIP